LEELKRLVTEQANDSRKVNTLLDTTSQRYGSQPDVSIGCSRKAKFFKEVAVLFIDFKQFSFVAEGIPAEYRVRSLDYFFKKFDRTTEKHH
jgi:class 3 adenylate cyclase